MKGKKIISLILDLFIVLLLTAIVSFTVSYFTNGRSFNRASILGYKLSYVMSDSMEPTIMTHALCLIKTTDDVETGDIVVYEYESSDTSFNIIHRIVGGEDGKYITKGDNNATLDEDPVYEEQIVGKVVCIFNLFAKIVD